MRIAKALSVTLGVIKDNQSQMTSKLNREKWYVASADADERNCSRDDDLPSAWRGSKLRFSAQIVELAKKVRV